MHWTPQNVVDVVVALASVVTGLVTAYNHGRLSAVEQRQDRHGELLTGGRRTGAPPGPFAPPARPPATTRPAMSSPATAQSPRPTPPQPR